MIRVRVWAAAGTGNEQTDFLEFEDGTTDEEIHQECREHAIDVTGFEFSWSKVDAAQVITSEGEG